MNKTIAQQLKITEFPFIIKDKNGKEIYYEASNGNWSKRQYNQNGNQIYYEDSIGFWSKRQYDQNGKEIYYENSNGNWEKSEYDQNGNQIYYENSNGNITDNRPKVVELTLDEIAKKLNIDVNLLKIKK
jgi:glucan-binding YG repeat protein